MKTEAVKGIDFFAVGLLFYAVPRNNKMWSVTVRLEQPPVFPAQRIRRKHFQRKTVLKDDTKTACRAYLDLMHLEFPGPIFKK